MAPTYLITSDILHLLCVTGLFTSFILLFSHLQFMIWDSDFVLYSIKKPHWDCRDFHYRNDALMDFILWASWLLLWILLYLSLSSSYAATPTLTLSNVSLQHYCTSYSFHVKLHWTPLLLFIFIYYWLSHTSFSSILNRYIGLPWHEPSCPSKQYTSTPLHVKMHLFEKTHPL